MTEIERLYHIGRAGWLLRIEHITDGKDGLAAGWYGLVGRAGRDAQFILGPHDEPEDVTCEFEQRYPDAKFHGDYSPVVERKVIRELRERARLSRNGLESRCGFRRGVVRRFEESIEPITSRNVSVFLTMTRVLDSEFAKAS